MKLVHMKLVHMKLCILGAAVRMQSYGGACVSNAVTQGNGEKQRVLEASQRRPRVVQETTRQARLHAKVRCREATDVPHSLRRNEREG